MRFVTQTLEGLLAAAGLQLEHWMAPAVAVFVALLILPSWRRNFRTKQARKRLLAASLVGGEERAGLEDEALELVHGHPFGLIVVAEEAHKRGMAKVARRALLGLEGTGKRKDELRRLRRLIVGELPVTAEGEALAIERLLEAGMDEQARLRFEAASARYPSAEALLELRERIP